MSDIGVSYNLSYSPNPVNVDLKLGIANTTLNVTLGGVSGLGHCRHTKVQR